MALPAYRETHRIRAEIQSLRDRGKRLESDTGAVKQLAERVRDLQQYVDEDLKTIPTQPDIAGMMRRLSLPVDGVTVKDQTFSAGSPKPVSKQNDAAYRVVPLTVELEASFDAFFSVLSSVEDTSRLVRIRSVHVGRKTPDNPGSDESTLDGSWLHGSVGLEAVFKPNATGRSAAADDTADGTDQARAMR